MFGTLFGLPNQLRIRSYLKALVLSCLVPVCLSSAYLVHYSYRNKAALLEQNLLSTANILSVALDRDMAVIQASLEALATSPALASGDMATFYVQAQSVLKNFPDSDIILADATGQQIVNSYKPFGSPLPKRNPRNTVSHIFETGRPSISNVFKGAVTGRYLIGVDVPVFQDARVRYDLAMTLPADRLSTLLRPPALPHEWLITILDGNKIIAGRSSLPEVYVGKQIESQSLLQLITAEKQGTTEGINKQGALSTVSFQRSDSTGWTVLVSVPKAVMARELWYWLLCMVAGLSVLIIFGLGMAMKITRTITRSVQSLIAPALALGRGEAVSLGHFELEETNEVAKALVRAAALLREHERGKEEANARADAVEELAAIVEGSDDAIVSKTLEGRITSWNRAAEKIYGYTSEEAIGKSISILVPKDSRDELSEILEKISRSEAVHGYDTTRIRKDGEVIHVSLSVAPIKNTLREVVGASSIARDITERKRAEEVLKESQQQLMDIINFLPDATLVIDREGTVIAWNRAIENMTGILARDMVGKGNYEYALPFYGERRPILIDLVLHPQKEAETKYVKMERKKTVLTGEAYMPGRQGEQLYLYATASVLSDLKGNVIGAIESIRDITQRKRAEKALQESEERLRTLINSTPDIVCFKDGEGRWLEANDADLELFELTGVDYKGKKDSELAEFSEFYREAFLTCERTDERVWQECGLTRDEEAIPCPSGTVKVYDVIKVPLFHEDGERKGLVVLGRDITERKQAEERSLKMEVQLRQAQKLEAIGTLAGGIAHDFNNILSPILGYTEMALSDLPQSNPLRADLEQVVRGALRAKDLVKQILTFSRYGRDQQRVYLDIGPILKEALKLLRASLPATIEIKENIEKGTALADATQIHQVVINLCTNASHAMEDGGTLEVSLVAIDLTDSEMTSFSILDLKPGPFLRLRVKDTGHGMGAETIGRIFDPYFSTKEVGKGSGLGLAVVHGIVKRHEGAILVHSEEGKGSTFDVYFPRIETGMEAPIETRSALPKGTERILLIDDEQMVLDLGTRILERLGYHVSSNTNGLHALDLFRSKPDGFDLIITDYTMPHITGTDLAKEILRIQPDVPIILCTGFSERVTERTAKDLGILEFAMKPLEVNQLARLVRKILDAAKR